MMKAILTTFTPAEQKRTVIFPLLRHSRWFGRDKYWTKGSGLWVQEGNKWRPYTPSKIHSNGNAQWVIPEGVLVLRVTLTINKSRSFTLRLYEGIAPHIDGNTYVTIQIYTPNDTAQKMLLAFIDQLEQVLHGAQQPYQVTDHLNTVTMNRKLVLEQFTKAGKI